MKLCIVILTTLLAGCAGSVPHPTDAQIAAAKAEWDKGYAQNLKYLTENSAQAKFAKWQKDRDIQCKTLPRLMICKPGLVTPILEVNVTNNVVIITK